MSTKKDKFSRKDKNYMRLALYLAQSHKGLTGENPSVGCVIVKNDNIISIGKTGINGTPHAEYNAIKNSTQNLKGSKMYVTLEPCNHYGKTPPCTNSIVKSEISEIFYPIKDIDKKVKGKSYKILIKNKIKVRQGILKDEIKDFYNSYFTNRTQKLPYVTGKIAVSKNNLIYSEKNKKITNELSDKLTHYLRYKNDAILISYKTLNVDNPKLNCRLKGYEKFSPIRVILDKNLEIETDSNIFKSINKKNTIIFYNRINNKKITILKKKGARLIKLSLTIKKHFNLKIILKKIFSLGVRNLLIEGGDKMTESFIKNRLFNEFYLFKSPKNLPKIGKYQIFSSLNILETNYIKKFKKSTKLEKDKITIYKR